MSPSGGLTPPPPQHEVRVHTMASDIASVEKSGGATPKPQYITMNPVGAMPPPVANIPHELPPLEGSGGGRKTLMWLVTLIVIVGFGSLMYTYGLPYFMTQKIATAPIETQTPPPTPQPPLPPPPPIPPPAPPITSLFGAPPDTLPAISIIDTTITGTRAALQAETQKKPTSGNFKEISIVDAQGKPLSFSAYLSILLPEAVSLGLTDTFKTAFEDSFGAYFFYDDNGVWPGYAIKLKPGSGIDIVTLTDRLQKFESSSYAHFFLAQPGAPEEEEFQTGQALQKYTDRYISLSQPGALFSYGLFGQYFIINTSNEGLKQTLAKLGL